MVQRKLFYWDVSEPRSWSSGYDRRLPSDGPGFNSRRTHFFFSRGDHPGSPGERIIFFPGGTTRKGGWGLGNKGSQSRRTEIFSPKDHPGTVWY